MGRPAAPAGSDYGTAVVAPQPLTAASAPHALAGLPSEDRSGEPLDDEADESDEADEAAEDTEYADDAEHGEDGAGLGPAEDAPRRSKRRKRRR